MAYQRIFPVVPPSDRFTLEEGVKQKPIIPQPYPSITIDVEGQQWTFKVAVHKQYDGYVGEYEDITVFFTETKFVPEKKWLGIVWKKQSEEPITLFSILGNIYDAKISKEYWKEKIEANIKRLIRQQEINSGKLL